MNSIGCEAEAFLIDKGTNDLSDLVEKIRNKNYGGIVIGNGIRGLASNFILFEKSST